ncbi:MAG: MarR family transcriptional regulator, partial [Chloroflexota bacterium]
MGSDTPETDRLDAMLEVWAREIPDLDPLTEGIVE